MQDRDLLSVDEDYSAGKAQLRRRQPLWRESLMRRVGKVVLAVCRNAAKPEPCRNLRCVLRPFCACAQAEVRAANRMETRVWLAVAFCGGLILLVALIRLAFAG